jgi:hypothetical protein
MVWNRPDQDQLEDTVEFPAVAGDDEPDGWRVHGERSADGWVTIEIIELAEGELSGEQAPNVPRADAAGREGGELMTGT